VTDVALGWRRHPLLPVPDRVSTADPFVGMRVATALLSTQVDRLQKQVDQLADLMEQADLIPRRGGTL